MNPAVHLLVPSQVVSTKKPLQKSSRKHQRQHSHYLVPHDQSANSILIPSQVVRHAKLHQNNPQHGLRAQKHGINRENADIPANININNNNSNNNNNNIIRQSVAVAVTTVPDADTTISSSTSNTDELGKAAAKTATKLSLEQTTISKTTIKPNKKKPDRRKAAPTVKQSNATTTAAPNTADSSKQKKKSTPPLSYTRFGNLPDIEWGSIPMDHLRQHPCFVPLPLPTDLPKLTCLEDARYIRQDSWQWEALHDGRCTTSQAVSALGFLEEQAGKVLGIPPTWQRRGIGAYDRLREPALRTVEEMNAVLLADNDDNLRISSDSNNFDVESFDLLTQNPTTSNNNLWKVSVNKNGSRDNQALAAKYLVKMTNKQRSERRRRALFYSGNAMGIRMMWGNAQEATSVLTALNYFTQKNPDVVVKEIGMCGAGLSINQTDGTSPSSLLIGATPDAVIEWPSGCIEALEVKNHCPFVTNRPSSSSKKKSRTMKQFALRELPFQLPYIFPLYVPQLMLEMLCLGPKCRSVVMVRQTATSGALIVRIHRDDVWIEEMLYWLQRFQQDFVERGEEPPSNFFFDSKEDGPRYRSFLESTKQIADNAELVARLPQQRIQRADPSEPFFLD